MAATLSHASSTDDLLTNDELELEKKQQCSPNHYDSDDTHGVPIMSTSQRTKPSLSICCTGKRVMIAVMFVAVVSLAVNVTVMFVAAVLAVDNISLRTSVGELYRRVDTLEAQCSSVGTYLTILNKTQLNSSSELEDHGVILSAKLENVAERMPIFENKLTQLNSSLSSLSDTLSSHRAYLGNLSSDLNDLSGELMATKELFFANTSALREEITQLSEDLDYANNNITDLSSAQKDLQLGLADVKDIHSGNISAIRQSLVHLDEKLGETNKHLDNLSFIQDGLQRDLGLTNEALQSNVSDLELKFSGEINRTEVQYTELWHNLGTTRGRLEANISALQESHGHLQEDLDRTKVKLQTLSSEHVDLQGDYNTTKHAFYTTKTAIEKNVTQVHALINNYSSVLGEYSRQLGDAARSRSTLTTDVNNLNTRINDHVDWTGFGTAWLDRYKGSLVSRIRDVEQQLASDAARVVPLGFLLLSAIALFVCYVAMF